MNAWTEGIGMSDNQDKVILQAELWNLKVVIDQMMSTL